MSGRADTGYETRDVQPRLIARFALGLFAVMALAAGASSWLLETIARGAEEGETHPMRVERELPRDPLLQADPAEELRRLRRAGEELVGGYGWIDRTNGIVRIPVERAMRIVAEEGLPARAPRGPEEKR